MGVNEKARLNCLNGQRGCIVLRADKREREIPGDEGKDILPLHGL